MKLSGKKIKEFFSGKRGIFIDKEQEMIFIDCENGKNNVIKKSKEDEYPDYVKSIFYSDMFDVVKLLEDDKDYQLSLVFNFLVIERVEKEGKFDVVLGISGERY